MPIGFAAWTFLMFCFGAIWGTIEAWKRVVAYGIFLALIVAHIILTIYGGATGKDVSLDLIKVAVGSVAFFIGILMGKMAYRQATGANRY